MPYRPMCKNAALIEICVTVEWPGVCFAEQEAKRRSRPDLEAERVERYMYVDRDGAATAARGAGVWGAS